MMMKRKSFLHSLVAGAALAGLALGAQAQQTTEISFYFPVAVGGPITKLIDEYAADFTKENPGIKVTPIYAGSYQDTIVKALTAHKAGTPPVTSVLLSTDMFTLIDEDAIVPIDNFVKTADDRAWLNGFYKAFMLNSQTGGKTWGVPFQRSTVVLYYNKELLKAAGLDPNKPPATWAEMMDYAKKLTVKDSSGKVTQWGVQIPSSGFPYWLFQGLAIQNNVAMANDAGNAVRFDDPGTIEALTYWTELVKAGVHPPGIVEWGTTPKDFFEKKVAMMWTTTGNLTNVRTNAKFDFGVAMLPAGKRRGSPTGGGNFYIFKKATPAQHDAA
jgi:sn-glycerol 3-phosphate transport system substrate-binding protein